MHQRKNVIKKINYFINTFYYEGFFYHHVDLQSGFCNKCNFQKKNSCFAKTVCFTENLYYKSCKYYFYTHFLLTMFIPELAVGLFRIVLDPL